MSESADPSEKLNINYQKPHPDIMELADVPVAPAIIINDEGNTAILLYRNTYKSISEISDKEMRLGGLRINPRTNIGSRIRYYKSMKILDIPSQQIYPIEGLPPHAQMAYYRWSPDQSKLAFTLTEERGVSLWVLDVNKKKVTKLTKAYLNANIGVPFVWLADNQTILYKKIPNNKVQLVDRSTAIPKGPVIAVNEGKKAQNRTFQDLLKNPTDEHNFEQLASSELWLVHVKGGVQPWMSAELYRRIVPSPDGKYCIISKIHRPYSYLVPYHRFPFEVSIVDKEGQLIRVMENVPLQEDLPQGFMAVRKGRRNFSWRPDHPSSLVWMEALDDGDPAKEVAYRDGIYQLSAPFTARKKELIKLKLRAKGVEFSDSNKAIAYDFWWNTRQVRTLIFNPEDQHQDPEVFNERNYQDKYNDPGYFVTHRNQYGKHELTIHDDHMYLIGEGYSPAGKLPFIDQYNLQTRETKRLYQTDKSETLEDIIDIIDFRKGIFLCRLQSKKDYPNYYFRNFLTGDLTPITNFANPFKILQDVHKEVITYHRKDGTQLNATLYLPVGYDKEKKEKLPLLMWAYPREYKTKDSAGQVTASVHSFTYPHYGSPIYWVNRGYVVLDDVSFPIIGEEKDHPNDEFVQQLISNAEAAVDAVDQLGYIDRGRIAVGGHSYGAFMSANLLTHTDLFAGGIARSGAYNRTLTPFGFQNEERTFWEAPEVYNQMSPFMHADKVKAPLLLIHGEADNNSGTYPMQSERYFNALKGLGATVRLVILPHESHGYTARESILHMLWEQDQWLEKYVKNRKKEEGEG